MSNKTFLTIVSGNETLEKRLDGIVNHVIENANAHFGVILSKADVVSLPEVRIATMAGSELSESVWLKEAMQLQVVKDAQHRKEVDAAIARGEEEALSEIKGMSRSERITWAREKGHTGSATAKPKPTAAEEGIMLRKIASLKSPQARINLARKWNLV